MSRIVEVYTGEYAAGKSENALNRALEIARRGRKVTLVDLDIVEPAYTLRPIQDELRRMGVGVIAWRTEDTAGLGEAGTTLHPAARWALRREGDVILDLGYGTEGIRTLNLVVGANTNPRLKVYNVVNTCRPLTAGVRDVVEQVRAMGRSDGLINNTHLGPETTVSVVQDGARKVAAAAKILGLRVTATAVAKSIDGTIGRSDCMGNPVRELRLMMHKAFW